MNGEISGFFTTNTTDEEQRQRISSALSCANLIFLEYQKTMAINEISVVELSHKKIRSHFDYLFGLFGYKLYQSSKKQTRKESMDGKRRMVYTLSVDPWPTRLRNAIDKKNFETMESMPTQKDAFQNVFSAYDNLFK